MGRCGSFSPQRKCQCDSMCAYYDSCCEDFYTTCPKKGWYSCYISGFIHSYKKNIFMLLTLFCFLPSARGDTFEDSQDVTEAGTSLPELTTPLTPTVNTVAPTVPSSPTTRPDIPHGPTVEPDAAPCSGQPFDAFLQLKNGSIYAFRGKTGPIEEFLSVKEPLCIYIHI